MFFYLWQKQQGERREKGKAVENAEQMKRCRKGGEIDIFNSCHLHPAYTGQCILRITL
jgi:hypothetical protein